jgi:hypothetical protein
MVSRTDFPDGRFIDVTFDCVTTIDWPTAGLFSCEVAGVTNLESNDVIASCSVVIQPPAAAPAVQ